MEFNRISSAINRIVTSRVIPDILAQVHAGARVRFTGAAEVHAEHPELHPLRVIPIAVEALPRTVP
jgi:hypothetical protein